MLLRYDQKIHRGLTQNANLHSTSNYIGNATESRQFKARLSHHNLTDVAKNEVILVFKGFAGLLLHLQMSCYQVPKSLTRTQCHKRALALHYYAMLNLSALIG